mmetsp:Transcript_59403/g.121692  ORF Transcript_59403/g.121692 Transcript_59403/m.121692 type:complete len:227 (-) Transcript_59403:2124-2804(-)
MPSRPEFSMYPIAAYTIRYVCTVSSSMYRRPVSTLCFAASTAAATSARNAPVEGSLSARSIALCRRRRRASLRPSTPRAPFRPTSSPILSARETKSMAWRRTMLESVSDALAGPWCGIAPTDACTCAAADRKSVANVKHRAARSSSCAPLKAAPASSSTRELATIIASWQAPAAATSSCTVWCFVVSLAHAPWRTGERISSRAANGATLLLSWTFRLPGVFMLLRR